MNKQTYYEVKDGHGYIGKNSQYKFNTAQDAIDMATEFKNNPRSHNEQMTDENVQYWMNKTYTVIEKTVTTKDIISL
jgi:hypothetical protein